MNKNIKNLIIFGVGLISGVGLGIVGTKEYWKKKANDRADKEIEEMDEYFRKKNKELIDSFEKEESSEKCDAIKEEKNIKHTSGGKVEYSKVYSEIHPEVNILSKNIDDAEKEHPLEEDSDDSMENLCKTATVEHNENRNRTPKIISEDSLGELPGYIEEKTLLYYTDDDVLTDEEDNVIEDPKLLIGDALDKYNFRESEEDVIYVRNYGLDTVYEIEKMYGSYDDLTKA